MTYKILLPVDGSDGASHAAEHVARLAGVLPNLEVHLLNVQSRGDDWMVRRVIKPEELQRMEDEWAEAALVVVRQILEAAGVQSNSHVRQGEVPQTIIKTAAELGCDQIIMGARGLGSLGNLILGSVANKVLHLATLPLTLVK